MKFLKILLILGFGFSGLVLCNPSIADDTRYYLDASIITEEGEDNAFVFELAYTPELREKGLMHRTELAPNSGMLFIWPDEGVRLFWMKDTPLALDILFFDRSGKLVSLHPNARPNSLQTISSFLPVKYVVEIAAQSAAQKNITFGSQLRIKDKLPATR